MWAVQFLLTFILRGWDKKLEKNESPQKDAYVLFHYGAGSRIVNSEDYDWCPDNNIMNNPYEKSDNKYTWVTAKREYFENSEYYPSPNDNVHRIHLNTNFAPGKRMNTLFRFRYRGYHHMSHVTQKHVRENFSFTWHLAVPLRISRVDNTYDFRSFVQWCFVFISRWTVFN